MEKIWTCNKLFINRGWSQATADTLTQGRKQVVRGYMETSLYCQISKVTCIVYTVNAGICKLNLVGICE